jgi:transposase
MAMFVGLDVSLKTTSICVVGADGSRFWEGKVESEPPSLVKALARWRNQVALVGIEACPLSEWLYGACVESGLQVGPAPDITPPMAGSARLPLSRSA